MAEKLSEVQEHLKREITCTICLDVLKDPRALPCTHVYCKDCLQKELFRSQRLSACLKCPECRREVEVLNNNVENLAKDFRTLRLINVYKHLRQLNGTATRDSNALSDVTHDEATLCHTHREPLSMYCITCKDVHCKGCEMDHSNHNYGYLIKENDVRKNINSNSKPPANIYNNEEGNKENSIKPSHKDKLSQLSSSEVERESPRGAEDQVGGEARRQIEPGVQKEMDKISMVAKDVESKVSVALVEVTKVQLDMETQAQTCRLQIDAVFEGMINLLQERRQWMHRELEEELRNKKEIIAQQKEQLRTTFRELIKAVDECSSEPVRDRHRTSQHMMNLQLVSERVRQTSLKPAVTPHIGRCLTNDHFTKACCKNCTFKLWIPDIEKCYIEGDFLTNPEPDTVSHIHLHVRDSKGTLCPTMYNLIEAELLCTRHKSVTIGGVECARKGVYRITLTTGERGRHVLHIRVNHVLVPQCPFPLFLHKRPQTYVAPVTQIQNQNGPTGLQIFMDNLLVSEEYSFTVSSYDARGGRVFSLEMGGEVAVDMQERCYFVANSLSHEVYKFDANGRCLKKTGGQGSNPGQFHNPSGMCVHNGELFVTDSLNHRVQVFDGDLNLLRHFGRQGVERGCFNYPKDVAVDSKGNLYITDMLNNRIQVVTKTGQFLRIIQNVGQQRLIPHTPCKLNIHRELVFVTECQSNTVSIFTQTGSFVASFGHGYIIKPDGIVVNNDGYVYVSSNKEKIVVF